MPRLLPAPFMPMCMWQSMRPGVTNLPVRSMTSHPSSLAVAAGSTEGDSVALYKNHNVADNGAVDGIKHLGTL